MQESTYTRCGDYYIPDIYLDIENRPIGRWGRIHRGHIKEHHSALYSQLCLNGRLWTYLADLNEQVQDRFELIIEQLRVTERVAENMKQENQMAGVGMMNSIRDRAEELIIAEIVYR